jgi:hypothetical protein
MASIFFVKGQTKTDYIDLAKKDTVTINILTDKQTPAIASLQTDLSKSVENQSKLTTNLVDVLSSINQGLIYFYKEIEKRNKNDSNMITTYFNYSNSDVKKAVHKNHIIFVLSWIITMIYMGICYFIRAPNQKHTPGAWLFLILLYNTIGVLIFFTLKILLTFIFNPAYFEIKKILDMYI